MVSIDPLIGHDTQYVSQDDATGIHYLVPAQGLSTV